MNKNIENIYLDFFEYYDTVKEKLDLIYDKCENVDCLFAGIIDNLRYYYDNKNDVVLPDDLINYFEHEDFLNSIIHKIKYTIDFVNLVYYNVLNEDVDMFNNYILVMYYTSILEDLLLFIQTKELDSTEIEDELKELNELIYNKVEVTNSYIEYISNKIAEISKIYEGFFPSIAIFNLISSLIQDPLADKEEFISGTIEELLNNMGSLEELSRLIDKHDIELYNKILKLENVLLKLIFAKRNNEVIFEENNTDMIDALIIELANYYNIWLTELHRIYDLYGIEYVIKYQDLIYYSSLIKDIVDSFGDIIENDEGLGDYFLALYDSILNNNMDDFEQFVLYGIDLLDDLCEHYELNINKAYEEIEFLYTLFINKKI